MNLRYIIFEVTVIFKALLVSFLLDAVQKGYQGY